MAAADILCRFDRDERALAVLAAALSSKDAYIRLDAANRLDRLCRRARPAWEALRKAENDPNGDVQKVVRHALQ